ncbi:Crp/Fnr family transcriptional regulator [Rhodoplanes sp. TEM]|uniref:Crp/Fnr family transcriptional regulator n=1 Tax=Rhodoplanes tepidamans TaxID=200616 RepID=A0ABT5J3R0_RHOTP|nr:MULTISPECIES: Crp/Fnr family transcriptional regulator [Rhodoplanes]MDC7784268.1 Crp/Fnr family transcriptional regulator [Rhodoplanes tepidamans]MDC7983660.1 Crp/Fnr family transcriptional regulator [Rhodoplanes sp. TEM]MDQ0353670.1 CRP-like cAMP-binding protein [Rhodoplanes tepidamans]
MSIEDDIGFLAGVPTFRLLGPNALRILAIGCESRSLGPGDVLFRAGEAADCGYVVQEGAFRLDPDRTDGSLVTVGPGVLLGEMALLIDTVRPVTATATEPAVVMRIPRQLFLKMLEGFPDAAFRLRDHLAERALETADDIAQVRANLDPGR